MSTFNYAPNVTVHHDPCYNRELISCSFGICVRMMEGPCHNYYYGNTLRELSCQGTTLISLRNPIGER